MPRISPYPLHWSRVDPPAADGTVARRRDGVRVIDRRVDAHRPYAVHTADDVELTVARGLTAGGAHRYSSVSSAIRIADLYLPLAC